MTTPHGRENNGHDDGHNFDWERAEQDINDQDTHDAEVVDLDAVRRRSGRTPNPDDNYGDDDEDRESVAVNRQELGKPVDPPDEPQTVSGWRRRQKYEPVFPQWLLSKAAIFTTVKWAAKDIGYVVAYHAVRTPKYTAKALMYAPVGLSKAVTRLLRWAMAEQGNGQLRQFAADRNDPDTWLKLDRQRQRQSKWRWGLLIAGAIGAFIAWLYLLYGPLPALVRWVLVAGSVPLFARLGRPADKPITDRVSQSPRYRKLTADLVRRALTSIGIAGINSAVAKDPQAISFPVEIHRDGPGHLAIVDLPHGVEASEVVARRGRLASGLRLPLDQVWPEPVAGTGGHTGRLALWVGYEPASAMRQPAWPLLHSGKVDVFESFPFATTPRMQTVQASVMFRNWLVGGQPGSGKTFALRLAVLAAILDARVELRGYELKGVGDFKCVEPVCTEYGNGFDDDTIARCAAMVKWLYAECERRSKRIDHYHGLGKAPENKITPELASLKGSGLHPLVVFIDEAQELFQHPRWGKEAGEIAEKVVKLGRALGVILFLGTQIPDKDSLPTGITRNINTRFCLSVQDQTANDMILGTSMYKNGYRATTFQPGDDAGWGIVAGLGKPAARRSFYVGTEDAKKIVERAISFRIKAGTMPAPEEKTRDTGPSFDLLADIAHVWPVGESAAWNETLCIRLADLRPDVYAGWQPEQLTATLTPYGVKSGQISRRIAGKTVNRRGIKFNDLTTVITERNRRRAAE